MESVATSLPPPPYPEGGQAVYTTQHIVQNIESTNNNEQTEDVQNQKDETQKGNNIVNITIDDNEDIQKKLLYKHPLFPLMALLFEKCEQATQTSDCPSSESFDVDIQAFVQHQETDNKPFLLDIPELDGLMVKAIQVLRIHLLELEKVNDLCQDFCQRYITCLKGKLQNEQLLRIEGMDSPEHEFGFSEGLFQTTTPVTPTNSGSVAGLASQGQILSGNTVYQMVQTPQGLVAQPIQITVPAATSPVTTSPIQGSTPMSQIGVSESPTQSLTLTPAAVTMLAQSEDEEDKKSPKRGILPKQATQIMKSWLFQHIVHPYPTEEEKKILAGQTGLSILQINNWFINARRRILQPMLDQSNPDGAKQKKVKPPQNRPQKYWPESLSQISQVSGREDMDSEEDSMNSQSSGGHKENASAMQMAEILQGMNHTVNADVTSIINNVQQATHALVAQNGQLDPASYTSNSSNNTSNIDRAPTSENS